MKQINVRDGKGSKDRVNMLPENLIPELKSHREYAQARHNKDLGSGLGNVYLLYALTVKYKNADKEF